MYSYKNFYIGARDFVTEGTFTWSDGSSNAFASSKMNKDTTPDTKDWVYITSGGTWTESTGLSADKK